MRLINAITLDFHEYMDDRHRSPYAILSHTWGAAEEEVTHAEWKVLRQHAIRTKRGAVKIVQACERDETGYDVFILLESMSPGPEHDMNMGPFPEWYNLFIASRWFTRGWTLQELIAPRRISFFAYGWIDIGSGLNLARLVTKASRIPMLVLQGDHRLTDYSVAQRMSWASRRVTTRVEDRAYCLLGIFGVNMPLLYGEREAAFIRLQEEILRSSADLSILAWDYSRHELSEPNGYLLSPSPAFFAMSAHIRARGPTTITISNSGFGVNIPVGCPTTFRGDLLVLNCYDTRYPSFNLALSAQCAQRDGGLVGESTTWSANCPPRLHLVRHAAKIVRKDVSITRAQALPHQYARQAELLLNLLLVQGKQPEQRLPLLRLEQLHPQQRWDFEALSYNAPLPQSNDIIREVEVDGYSVMSVRPWFALSESTVDAEAATWWTITVSFSLAKVKPMTASTPHTHYLRNGVISLRMMRHEGSSVMSLGSPQPEHNFGIDKKCGVCSEAPHIVLGKTSCVLVHWQDATLVFTGLSSSVVTFDILITGEHTMGLTITVRKARERDLVKRNQPWSRRLRNAIGSLLIWVEDLFPVSGEDSAGRITNPGFLAVARLAHRVIVSAIRAILTLLVFGFGVLGFFAGIAERLDPVRKRLPRPWHYTQWLKRRRIWATGTPLNSKDLGGWYVEQSELAVLRGHET
ncbi:hypothetical protein LTR27_007793 [Elasticomyces elasticus]|nr:hypothetical protein LTR27_007793 [Elasticomyces elasticus]